MFNGHMDTSYSGREPWLAGIPGFQPEALVEDDRIFGLGISNMKGALACYVEAVRALQDGGRPAEGRRADRRRRRRDREDAVGRRVQGEEYRGYAAGSRHLVAHGGVADMCILGEPTEGSGSCSATTARSGCGISTRGHVHPHGVQRADSASENSILRMHDVLDAVLEWIPDWQDDPRTRTAAQARIVNVGALRGGFAWRVSRTPHRTDLFLDVRVPPTKPMAEARARRSGLGARPRRSASPTSGSTARST